ncbi:MAG: hypothetical protein PWQ83_1045 [Thermosipho sp. (in: thermotogales)]|nr:hypothetical protein [Thermosipho sp. (in: thermotogales)]
MLENVKTEFKNLKIGNFKIEKEIKFTNPELKKLYEEFKKILKDFRIIGIAHHQFQEIYFLEKDGNFLKVQIFCNKDFKPTKINILKATSQKIADDFVLNLARKNNENIIQAFIDGSFKQPNKIGAGVVIIDKENIYKFYKFTTKYPKHRNVTGEILSALLVFEYAKNEKIKKIEIFYDYNGIKLWATGEWKAKTELTKMYKKLYDYYSKFIEIHFSKVKAHTGNTYNELADKLAKKAILEEKTRVKYDINFITEKHKN